MLVFLTWYLQNENCESEISHRGNYAAQDKSFIEANQFETAQSKNADSHSDLEAAHNQFDAAHSVLTIAHCQFKAAHCDLITAHDVLNFAHNEIATAHSQMEDAHNVLISSYNEMTDAHNVLKTAHSLLKPSHKPIELAKITLFCKKRGLSGQKMNDFNSLFDSIKKLNGSSQVIKNGLSECKIEMKESSPNLKSFRMNYRKQTQKIINTNASKGRVCFNQQNKAERSQR
ncbi:MAG: hypothetical protein M1480_20715 [Bacteroidetes bacterium]|nr:hypothetical protein [Bacteroidota bacterium]